MELDFTKPAPKPNTLEECHAVIEALWNFCALYQKEFIALKNEVMLLKKENEELKEKLNLNSNNSSKPPSSDLFKNKKNKQPQNKSNRKQGGQPGHKGYFRSLLPTEKVDHIITHRPPDYCECGDSIKSSKLFKRHQVHELPLVKPVVTEHQLYSGICSGCGKEHCAKLPLGTPKRMLGPLAMAKIALLTGKYRISKRNSVNLLKDLFGFSISIGTVSNIEKTTSPALMQAVEEVKNHIPKQPNVHCDETSHQERNKKMWTWVAATLSVCAFFIRKSRGMTVAQEILGKNFQGILNSDRFTSYSWVYSRQLCWSHLKRDFTKISERSGKPGRIGDGLLAYCRKMFMYWNRVKSDTLGREKFIKLMHPIRVKVEALLEEGERCGHLKTERTCAKILEFKEGLWSFIDAPGVEPTNNHAERLLRGFVIWRKTSFGTQSAEGSLFMERLLTISGSCQLQKRNVLEFLYQSIVGYLQQTPMPSLLPKSCPEPIAV